MTTGLVDPYLSAVPGLVHRNAWRFAVSAEGGVDFRISALRVGPNAGILYATEDSVGNSYSDVAFTFGLRAGISF